MRRKVTAVLAAVALVFALGGVAAAGDFTLVPSTIPGCGANPTPCTSPVSDVFGFTFLGTTFSHTAATGAGGEIQAGDTFSDVGALVATSLKSGPSTAIAGLVTGLRNNWDLGAIFTLPGVIDTTSGGATPALTFHFTSGTIDIYAKPVDVVGDLMNQNNPLSITAGTKVATLSLIAGDGTLDFSSAGSIDGRINIKAQFTDILDGFWQYLGVDVNLGTELFFALTDSNNNVIGQQPEGNTASNFTTFFGLNPPATTTSTVNDTWLSNDGSAEFAVVTTPNPSALLMLGSTLLALGSAAAIRRRS